MVFRRTTVVNLIITYLRRTVMPNRLTKPTLFADMKHDLQDVDIIVTNIFNCRSFPILKEFSLSKTPDKHYCTLAIVL